VIYGAFFRAILARLDAERAHRLGVLAMRALVAVPGLAALLARLLRPRAEIAVEALGLRMRSPLGVAAGLDKEATWFRGLTALGFGFVEVGTVTARGQPGNPGTRVTRLARDRALLNAMGFPNEGAAAVAARLRGRRGGEIVGVNIGKTKAVALEEAVEDYRASTRLLAPHADYLVLNVSSPNTPGLREMQSLEALTALIGGVREEVERVAPGLPLLVKIAPDLSDDEVDRIADLALELELDGVVATNTTVRHELAASSAAEIEGAPHGGGISGAPLKGRSLEVLTRLRARAGGRLVLVSVGGIETPEDAWERILAGADLLQAYTAFVYRGPLWPHRIDRGLAGLLRESPWTTIGEAVGKGSG
jgi:dihydroorotate dehydrogenase